MSFQFCKEGTPSDPIRRQTVVVYTLTLNVIQTRQLIDLKKSSSLFWMGWIVDQSQEGASCSKIWFLFTSVHPPEKTLQYHLKKFTLSDHFVYQPSWENFHKMLWLLQHVTLNKIFVPFVLMLVIWTMQSTEQSRRVLLIPYQVLAMI